MEDLTLRLESRPFGRAAFPQVFHNALDSASLRPQPLGKRRAFSTATTASTTTNDALRLNSKGDTETRPVTAQSGHFINTGSLSAPNTKCPLSLGIGVRFRRNPQHPAKSIPDLAESQDHKCVPGTFMAAAMGPGIGVLAARRRGKHHCPSAPAESGGRLKRASLHQEPKGPQPPYWPGVGQKELPNPSPRFPSVGRRIQPPLLSAACQVGAVSGSRDA